MEDSKDLIRHRLYWATCRIYLLLAVQCSALKAILRILMNEIFNCFVKIKSLKDNGD
jgi:hypothetical protein